jgi:hypothetical protein
MVYYFPTSFLIRPPPPTASEPEAWEDLSGDNTPMGGGIILSAGGGGVDGLQDRGCWQAVSRLRLLSSLLGSGAVHTPINISGMFSLLQRVIFLTPLQTLSQVYSQLDLGH